MATGTDTRADRQTQRDGLAVDDAPTYRRPAVILPVPTPSPPSHVRAKVPDTQLTREATGLLREFSTPLLFNHSHRVFFWANELGRQTGKTFDAELVFICAAFHDFGLLKTFSSETDRFEVDSANAVRQFLSVTECQRPDPDRRDDNCSTHNARHRSIQAVGGGAPVQRSGSGCARYRIRDVSRRSPHVVVAQGPSA